MVLRIIIIIIIIIVLRDWLIKWWDTAEIFVDDEITRTGDKETN